MFQLRIHSRDNNCVGFEWRVVNVYADPDRDEGLRASLESGSDSSLDIAVKQGAIAFKRAITTPEGPVRHQWECACGAQLVLEAHRSKKSPYSWDTPRELTCTCGRVYGVKLNFIGNPGLPSIEPLYRTMLSK